MTGIEIKWTPFALRCLDEIHFYIFHEAGSASPADRFVNQLFDRVDQLVTFPQSGQVELSLSKRGLNCRYLVVGNYKIIKSYTSIAKSHPWLSYWMFFKRPRILIKLLHHDK